MSIVQELRNDILNKKRKTYEIARKALTMSILLKLDDITKWLNCELDGYGEKAEVPDYRKLSGELDTHNYEYSSRIDNTVHPIGYNNYILRDSIHILEAYISKEEYKEPLQVTNEYTKNYSKNWYLSIEKIYISKILKQIEDQVLRLTLELENQGILGGKMTFTEKEKETAKTSNITINVLGDWKNSPFSSGEHPTQPTNYNTDK